MADVEIAAGRPPDRTPRGPLGPLDERASLAVGGVLTLMMSSILGVVVIPAAMFLLRDRIGRRAVIWASLGSACVGGVMSLGVAWQWWKLRGEEMSDYRSLSSFDLSTLSQVGPVVAAVVVIVLCLAALNARPAPSLDDDEADIDEDEVDEAGLVEQVTLADDELADGDITPRTYALFGRSDVAVILVTLAYLFAVQPYWFY